MELPAQQGGTVDNLVLIAAPINQSLVDQIQSLGGIENVIVVDLRPVGDTAYPGMNDLEILYNGITDMAPDMVRQKLEGGEDGYGHFYYNGSGEASVLRRDDLAKDLKSLGVE